MMHKFIDSTLAFQRGENAFQAFAGISVEGGLIVSCPVVVGWQWRQAFV
jgi:hypothetical protein